MLQEIHTQCQVAPTGEVRAVSQDQVSTCLWKVPPGRGGGQNGSHWSVLPPLPPAHPACHPAQKNSSLSKGPGSVFVGFVGVPCTSPLSQDGVPCSFWSQSLRPESLPRVGAQVRWGCLDKGPGLSDCSSGACFLSSEAGSRAGSPAASPLGLSPAVSSCVLSWPTFWVSVLITTSWVRAHLTASL